MALNFLSNKPLRLRPRNLALMWGTAPSGKRTCIHFALTHFSLLIVGILAGFLLSATLHQPVLDLRHTHPSEATTASSESISHGILVDIAFKQGLSHAAFHAPDAKRALASLVGSRFGAHGAVAVVGVEWGAEVLMFAADGYTVYAFEPMKKFHDAMQHKLTVHNRRADAGLEPRWDVRLHNIAAGEIPDGNLTLSYNTEQSKITETVHRGRVDDFIDVELDVLSVDIQGNELDVLKGAKSLLSSKIGVRSLWIEIFSCNPKVLEIFHLLDRDYVIFDFVPWGRPLVDSRPEKRTMSLTSHESFIREDGRFRPSEFNQYFNWFCQKRQQHFQWLQTDVLAVRRDLVTPEFLVKLSTLANNLFVVTEQKRKGRV